VGKSSEKHDPILPKKNATSEDVADRVVFVVPPVTQPPVSTTASNFMKPPYLKRKFFLPFSLSFALHVGGLRPQEYKGSLATFERSSQRKCLTSVSVAHQLFDVTFN